jgi:hypothetical protein
MKKTGKYLLSCFILFFFSCEEGVVVDYGYDKYYEELATATNEKEVFLLDNGKILFNPNPDADNSFKNNDRVFLHYSLLPETKTAYDQTIRINFSSKIPLGKLTSANKKEITDAPAIPVHFESVWIGSHYLNMQLYINRFSEAHSIGLLADASSLQSDTIRIYFKHDNKKDTPGYPAHLILSFDLEELLGNPEHEKNLLLNIVTDNYGDKTYKLNY